MQILRKVEVEKSYNPLFKHKAVIYISLDDGEHWNYAAAESFVNTKAEAEAFLDEYKKRFGIAS